MERKDILTNFKSIDYEGLKMDQILLDYSDMLNTGHDVNSMVSFKNIYFGLLSIN